MRWLTAALILCTATSLATPAAAALRLCNRTSYILYAASGTATDGTVTTKGWTRLIPGGCATAIQHDLGPDTFVYAHTSQAHDGPAHDWGGTLPLCVKDTDFTLETPAGADRCGKSDAYTVPFRRLEPGGQTDWTTTFTQSPRFATASDASRAGLARLLADLGYHIGTGAGGLDRALDKFRVRMKMTADAGTAALFDALETDAMKVAAPAGYSVCNDTNETLWSALAFRRGKAWAARGWWQMEAGACVRALTTALQANHIYLLVERKNGKRIVTGKTEFCIASVAFDIEKRGDCKTRGLTAAGFATTDTRGRSGFTAHVSEDGLLPPLRLPQ